MIVMAKKECSVPWTHHSKDRVSVFHGSTQPTIMCGFHASDLTNSLRKIREGKRS